MLRRVFSLGAGMVGLALVAVLVMGLAGTASAFAAQHKPVVTSVSPKTGLDKGGATVTITGRNFKINGKSVVKQVKFGAKAATHVRVKSSTTIKVTAPAGTGKVDVRVTTKAGTSRKVAADKYTYRVLVDKYIVTASSYAPVAGADVTITAQLASAGNDPIHSSGVVVTWSKTGTGGSFGSGTSTTDASGIATVTFTTDTTVGTEYAVTATDGSSRTGTSPTITTGAKALEVEYNGTPVKAYSLAELGTVTPFAGYAGYKSSGGTVYGPDAVTGAKVTDIVADALGTPLSAGESVEVAEASPYYGKKFSYSQLTDPTTGFTMFTTSGDPMTSFTGTLGAVLVYSDPAGTVMPAAKGPLRFFVADTVSETVMTGSFSISNVDTVNVLDPAAATQIAVNAGDGQSASAGTAVSTKPSVIVEDVHNNPVPGVSVTFAAASGGGSATGLTATTNAAGIATVGSWTLGGSAGANTLTAASGTLTGSPVTFTATGTAGVLQVKHNGTAVRSYSLTELQAVTPFAGYAGYKNKAGAILGPDAVTGARISDIVADALGTPLAAGESVEVAEAIPYFGSILPYAKVTDPGTGFTMYTTAGDPMTSFTGTLAAVLVYSDPAGVVMPAAKGPLRFFVADGISETLMTGSDSVTNVDVLNVIDP